MGKIFYRRLLGFATGLSLMGAAFLFWLPGESTPGLHAAPAASEASATRGEAAVIGRDPETGAFRAPTAAERKALTPEPARAEKPQPAWRLSRGGVAMRAPEHMTSYSVVRLRPDGTLEHGCIDGKEAATAWCAGEEGGECGHDH